MAHLFKDTKYTIFVQSTNNYYSLECNDPNQQASQMDDTPWLSSTTLSAMVPGEEGLKDIRVVEAVYGL